MYRKVNELKAENWRVQKKLENLKKKKKKKERQKMKVPRTGFELATLRWQNN